MPTPNRKRKFDTSRRRALELLAGSRDGCTEAIMLAKIVRAGLASATTERVVAGGRTMEVARVHITEAGRRALAELRWP
jgi:hypothetical protein